MACRSIEVHLSFKPEIYPAVLQLLLFLRLKRFRLYQEDPFGINLSGFK
jgi:hypothetical protein